MLPLAFLQNVGLPETIVIIVVAILVFGRNLPQAAARAAVQMQRLKRTVADLRRETGIDAEIRAARREFEQSVPRLSDFEKHPPARKIVPNTEAREDEPPKGTRVEGVIATEDDVTPSGQDDADASSPESKSGPDVTEAGSQEPRS